MSLQECSPGLTSKKGDRSAAKFEYNNIEKFLSDTFFCLSASIFIKSEWGHVNGCSYV